MRGGRKIIAADVAGLTFILGWTAFISWLLYQATEPQASIILFFLG
jgi:hypothetical protein